ncbi:hypothetical protein [Microbacterium pumilum]|uniref:Uncharacterized protein n=1 Tax=Microbacterium pumilum TaxID=344165 RepID=A0ABN2SW00_9MICO
MDSTTRFAVGGMATVVASVAVVCLVALTNSVALADSGGASIGAARVVVPSATPTATAVAPTPAPAPTPTTPAPTASAPAAPVDQGTETVEGPAPVDVSVPAPTTPAEPTVVDDAVAEAEATGTWDRLRAWANRVGWSDERIDAMIKTLEEKRAALEQAAYEGSSQDSADADRDAERHSEKHGFGVKKNRSWDTPDNHDR